MPQFSPGEVKTAIPQITAKPSGMDCEAEIFLGPDDATKIATSGRVSFVSTGASQAVRLPVTMPSEGTYHGYIDVSTGGMRFLAYVLKEDVVIAAPALGPFSFGAVSVSFTSELVYTIAQMEVVVTNNNPISLQGKIYACWRWATEPTSVKRYRSWNNNVKYYQLSLAPGASQAVVSPFRFTSLRGKLLANSPYIGQPPGALLWFEDEFGGSSPVAGPF